MAPQDLQCQKYNTYVFYEDEHVMMLLWQQMLLLRLI